MSTAPTSPSLAVKLRAVYPALKAGVEYTLAPDGDSLATAGVLTVEEKTQILGF
jgi:hypothetical protein